MSNITSAHPAANVTANIFILEDDDSIRKLVTYALESQGFSARGFSAPFAFWQAMEDVVPSLLLLDIMLPEEDGISILKKLRSSSRTASLPVIMLTARAAEYDRVEGLDAGADDYIAKPFGMMELLARVRALLRRSASTKVSAEPQGRAPVPQAAGHIGQGISASGHPDVTAANGVFAFAEKGKAPDVHDPSAQAGYSSAQAGYPSAQAGSGSGGQIAEAAREIRFGQLQIFPARYEVYADGTEVALTNKEYQLLLLLVENEGIVLTREVLLDRIWNLGMEPENRTLDVHIRKLRAKLGKSGTGIETVRGVGYRFRK